MMRVPEAIGVCALILLGSALSACANGADAPGGRSPPAPDHATPATDGSAAPACVAGRARMLGDAAASRPARYAGVGHPDRRSKPS
jgi:hypothetical protein